MLNAFIGFDPRQHVAFNVAQFSLQRRCSKPVAVTPLRLETLPINREGLTKFTFSRFLVPFLMGFQGKALFIDSDFLILGDAAELFDRPKENKAVWVSKNPKRFEWASMILFDCAHPANGKLTPEYVQSAERLHYINWVSEDLIGSLPRKWNHLVGYDQPRPDAKAVHFTQGMPIFPETEGSEYRAEWAAEHKAMNSTEPWQATMGHSVHAAMTRDGRRVAKLHKDAING